MTNEVELFTKLLRAARLVNDADLNEAAICAKRLEIPLERALTMLKVASEERLRPAIKAKEMVAAGRLSLAEASKALQHANQHGIAFEEALPEKQTKTDDHTIHLSTTKTIHPFAEYLLAAKIVSTDQLTEAVQKAEDMNLPLGKTLVVNRIITRWIFAEILSAFTLVREQSATKEQALKLLPDALQRCMPMVQLLFEAGNYKSTGGDTLTLPELLIMAECLTEADFQDLQERMLLEKKSYVELIKEHNLVEANLLQSAISLLEMVGNTLKPFQAAEALRQVAAKKIPVYQAIAELKPPPQVPQLQLRIGDLLVEAGLVSREAVEKVISAQKPSSTLVRIGKQLLEAHLIDDTNLYNALRCQSAFREGILSARQAVAVLSFAYDEKLKLEEAFARCGVYVPIRMQWNWR